MLFFKNNDSLGTKRISYLKYNKLKKNRGIINNITIYYLLQ